MAEEQPDWAGIVRYVEDQARSRFPQMAWALSHPELGPLLRRAAGEGWDAARLQGELLKTTYYRTTDERARTWERMVNEDFATAKLILEDSLRNVTTLATRLGVSNLDFSSWAPGWVLAADAARYGWDEQRITAELLQRAQFGGDQQTTGALGSAMDRVKAAARAYLVPFTDDAAWSMGRQMLNGQLDAGGLEAFFKDQAVARFQGNQQVVGMLDRGITPQQIFAPMIQQTAQLLEIGPDQIDLMDPKYQAMIDHVDERGATRPMTLTESAKYVRGLSEYGYTRNAMTQAATVAEFLGQRMGAIA